MSCSKKTKNSELLELIAWGRGELLRSGVEEAQEECERILMKLLGCRRSELYLKDHEKELLGVREKFLTILEKREKRIPLAYLLNEADFWQETLWVDERCLIPRPETEILVAQVFAALDGLKEKNFSFLDIGTGSGAIAVAILNACKNARAVLLDISSVALEVARENLKRYALENRARCVEGDLFRSFTKNEKWDLIVSNPPYLARADWEKVQEELKFEPRTALDGGEDGLDHYREIASRAKEHLLPGGLLALEVGLGQAETVSKWLQTAGYDNIQRFKDHLQIERVVTARRNS